MDQVEDILKSLHKHALGYIPKEGEISPIDTALDKYHWDLYSGSKHEQSKQDDESVIRLSRVVIENFKGVKHGEINLKHGKKFFTPSANSDILGIYGQNGSGKTAVVEAIKLLKLVMSGGSMIGFLGIESDEHRTYTEFAEWINKDSDSSDFFFEFDYIEKDNTLRTVEYSFSLVRLDEKTEYVNRNKACNYMVESDYEDFLFKHSETRAILCNEVVNMGGIIDGKKTKMQPIIDTRKKGVLFTPESKMKYIVGNLTEDEKLALDGLKINHMARGSSFIFGVLYSALDNDYAKTLRRLQRYAQNEVHIVGNDGMNMFEKNTSFSDEIYPIYTPNGKFSFSYIDSTLMDEFEVKKLPPFIDAINPVINCVIPGVTLEIEIEESQKYQDNKYVLDEMNDEDSPLHGTCYVDLFVNKNGNKVPYKCESIGTRRLISELSMFVDAYNDPKKTLVIDEFDSGIFEFLLGELLQIFEESGKGQFIFTSHNLRPLEVLDKRCICFTTTNPENRYLRLKNIGQTNNLRSTYFREILLGDQDEELYRNTKKHKLMAAMKKAGK